MALEKRLPLWKVAAHDVDKPLWYLGYGSNMRSASMAGRNVTPLATKVVTVPTHYVTFDVFGIPYTEPCYASIEQFPDGESGQLHLVHRGEAPVTVPPLCGIAHHLTSSDFHRLLVTEGSGVVYDVVEVEAYELDDRGRATGASFPAYTLKAKFPQRPSGIPSARYMLVFDWGWRPVLKRIVRLTTWRVNEDGNCSVLLALLIVRLYQLMWTYHDVIHTRIFGEGDGSKLYWIRQ
nr:Glutamylcyclotransferase [Chaetomium cochliodes]